MSDNTSYTGTPTAFTTATDICVSKSPFMIPVISCLLGTPINLTSGRFTTGTGLSEYIFYFVNISTGRWSALYFIIAECSANDTSVDEFYTSFSLHDSMDFMQRDSISHSHIILAGRCHITNGYCNNLARHLCTT